MSGDTLRIALLTHSVNPRGGVVHALELARALHEAGRDVTVFAPAAPGDAMFRDVPCRVVLARVDGRPRGVAEMVRARIAAIKHALLEHDASGFDVLHAQDSITGNALAELRQSGEIEGFVRTVHHLDVFDDPRLERWQERAWREADQVLCVSAAWAATMRKTFGVDASVVPNGVDLARFARASQADMHAVRRRFGLHGAPVVLAIGGIEQRKNSIALLEAFARLRGTIPDARLVIAGGASLLDHDAYTRRFVARRRARAGDRRRRNRRADGAARRCGAGRADALRRRGVDGVDPRGIRSGRARGARVRQARRRIRNRTVYRVSGRARVRVGRPRRRGFDRRCAA
ncbi:glycosyltransferase-like protein [Burkholderia sp. 572]